MSKKYFIAIGLSILLLAAVPGFAQNLKLPYKDVGACPFECCTYRDWSAGKQITVFKTMSSGSAVAFKLGKGEKVRGMTGVVVTSVAGKAKVLKDVTLENSKVKVKKGETLLILTYMGEGFYRFWYRGRFFEESADAAGIKVLSQPKSVWWVKVRNRKGQIGWAISDGNFNNQDQCG
jgi:hypothetical protein